MKKSIFILIASIVAFCTSSCITEFGETPPKVTLPGKVIFDYSHSDIAKNILLADMALKLNAFIEATPDQKITIENRYFPKVKPRNIGNSWELVNGDFIFNTDGKPLENQGSKWIVTMNYTGVTDFDFRIEIECTGTREWKITNKGSVTESSNIVSSADLILKAEPYTGSLTMALYNYSVTGKANFTNYYMYSQHYKQIKVDYSILLPMEYVIMQQYYYPAFDYAFIAIKGKMEMIVSGVDDEKMRDQINSDLSSSVGMSVVNRITYRGVTESWAYYASSYLEWYHSLTN
ncbi:MAG: hypothetical protein PHG58_10665 [Clostridia bacterium]|nr:hypothetical protein [Clostridia bacterium]